MQEVKNEGGEEMEGLTHCLSIWDSNNDEQETWTWETAGHETKERRQAQ